MTNDEISYLLTVILNTKNKLAPVLAGPDFPYKEIGWKTYQELNRIEVELLLKLSVKYGTY